MWSRQEKTRYGPFCDEHSGEPQGLDQLASRLHDEAKRLADRYPASPQMIETNIVTRRPRIRATLTALATIAALLVAVASPMLSDGLLRHREADRLVSRFSSSQRRPKVSDTNDQAQVPSASESASSPTPAAGPSVESTVEVEAISFLLEVSDPELEALLDLFEEQRSEPTRLSI